MLPSPNTEPSLASNTLDWTIAQEVIPHKPKHYRRDIDGLRAIAVISVILFHAKLSFPGGFTGVDVFFVISGYLITNILQTELKNGEFSFLSFWERRIRRLFPALACMLFTVLLLGNLVFLPKDLKDLAHSTLAQLFLASNIYFWRDIGYFSGASELKPLLHMWSLSIEEQFYLIFPLTIIFVFRVCPKYVPHVLLTALLSSFLLSIYGTYNYPSATFYLLPTRAWELLTGCWIATTGLSTATKLTRELLSAFGLGLITFGVFGLDHNSPFPGLNACFPVLGAALIISTGSISPTSTGKLISTTPLAYIGKISYSLYLWHWPLFAYFRYTYDDQPSLGAIFVLIILTTVISILSYHFIEQPFRLRGTQYNPRPVFFSAISATAVLSLAVGYIHISEGFPKRMPDLEIQTPKHIVAANLDKLRNQQLPIIGHTKSNPSFIVWGDSHATTVIPLFDELAKNFQVAGLNAAHGGNPPIPDCKISWNRDLIEWNNGVISEIEKNSIEHVFLVARWASYLEGATNYDTKLGMKKGDPLIFESENNKSTEEAKTLMRNKLEKLVSKLTELHCTTYIVIQPPEQTFNPLRREFVNYRMGYPLANTTETTTKADYERHQSSFYDVIRPLSQKFNIQIIDNSSKFFSQTNTSILIHDQHLLYNDHQHLNSFGVDLLLRNTLNETFRLITN